MEELKKVLRKHAGRYPNMRPADAVKLIYQNEFGGGHLIKDEQACLNYLFREYRAVGTDASIPLYEDIGNGIVRVNLAAVKEDDLGQLGKAFIRSAAEHKGNFGSFFSKLALLKKLTGQGFFAFDSDALNAYLAEYERAGFPVVSHSMEYRNAYKPAYRIILRKYCR